MSDTYQAVQPAKIASHLKFRRLRDNCTVCRENKDTDQLHGYQPAGLGQVLFSHLQNAGCFS